jgi:dTDP-4-dehydrorhamnose reductase
MIKTVLIIGGSGFIGTHLAQRLREGYKVFATFHKGFTRIPGVTFIPLNIDNRNWVKRLMYSTQPDAVIYAAGNNQFEVAEHNSRYTELMHSAGPAVLASSADILQPRMIYLSNPYVFDGMKGNYHEIDTVLPWSTLGRMKLGGENAIRSKCLNYVILRSSPIFGRGNSGHLSFLDHLRMGLDRNRRIEVSHQELHSFSTTYELCEIIQRLIESGIRNRIMHFGGLTKITHFELAKAFATRFGYDPHLILQKAPTQRRNGVAEDFQFDFSLNSTQVAETLKIKPLLLEESLDLINQQLIASS